MKAEESIEAGEAPEAIAAQIKSLLDLIRRIDGYDEYEVSAPVAAGNGEKQSDFVRGRNANCPR